MIDEQLGERVITTVSFSRRCQHNKFIVDETLNTVECGICGDKLNPIWALAQFSKKEARVRQSVEAAQEIAKKAEAKNRCKCEHCKKMTRIVK